MPIVDPDDKASVVEKPNTVRIAAPESKTVVTDTRYDPAKSLLTNIEGSSWTVTYFSQVLDSDSALSGQNATLNPIYQQYRRINNFELKVTTPLTASQEADSKSMNFTGSANVYPFVIPNEGDMFYADIGDGKIGLFKVTASERMSVFKDTAHKIEYLMTDYLEDQRKADLEAKTVQTLHYVKDYLLHGQNPLIHEQDYQDLLDLEQWRDELIRKYFHWFTSREFKTLLVPGQQNPTYDPFAVKAITSFFDTRQAPELRHLRVLNVDGDQAMKSTCIWDALTRCDERLLRHGHRRTGLVFARSFERNPMMEGIYWSGIHYVVYPKDPELSVDYEFTARPKFVISEDVTAAPTRISSLQDIFAENTLFAGLPYSGAPVINSVGLDDHYVFSKAFYEESNEGQSKLELCVRDYLKRKALDTRVLTALCRTCHGWGGLERFYFIPILLILINAHIRGK